MGHTLTREQLQAIRKGSPQNTRLTVSRSARRTPRTPVAAGYSKAKLFRHVSFALRGTPYDSPESIKYLTRKLDALQSPVIPTANDIRLFVERGEL